jgi:hypothetical protein
VWAEQAIFTSLPRRGKSGYHLVARSRGVTDLEAGALTTWSPSHGTLIIDAANRTSVNYHGLPGGRCALARTCEGPAEYSGRGGRQLYTQILIVDERALRQAGNQPWALFRAALALGYFRYRPDPEDTLPPVRLLETYATPEPAYWSERLQVLGLASPDALVEKLIKGQTVALAYDGDRALLAESLTGLVPPETRPQISFATSLRPSMVRPFLLVLTGTAQ